MTRFKKMTAVLLSVVMFVCMFSVPASAATVFDDAISIKALETVSGNFNKVDYHFYKITLQDSGKITFYSDYTTGYLNDPCAALFNVKGETIIPDEPFGQYFIGKQYIIPEKGTYYIKIRAGGNRLPYKNFYYVFTPDETPTISLAVNVKVGDTLDFSALGTNYSGKVTWKTTKSAVATVEKGTVTAKKVGTAKIRAYMDNGDYAEIVVKVKKK